MLIGVKMNKIILISLGIIASLLLAGCNSEPSNSDDLNTSVRLGGDDSFTIEQCEARGFTDKVIMLESKYCSHCQKTMPEFISACEDYNVTPIILDLSINSHIAQLESYNIELVGTPTFIFGCDYIVGARDKKTYSNKLDDFLAAQNN